MFNRTKRAIKRANKKLSKIGRKQIKNEVNCLTKRIFLCRDSARKEAAKTMMGFYNCPICGNWHLTKRKEFYVRTRKYTGTIYG